MKSIMKLLLIGVITSIVLNLSSEEFNLAPISNTLSVNPWWPHGGGGTSKNIEINENGKDIQCIELTGGEISLLVDNYRYSPFLYSPAGRFCRFSVMAMGKASMRISIKTSIADETGKFTTKILASKQVNLTDEWQKIEIKTQNKEPQTAQNILVIEMLSGEKILLKDSCFVYFSAPDVTLKMEPRTILTKAGEQVKVKISMTKAGKPLADVPVNITVFKKLGTHLPDSSNAFTGKTTTTELKTDKDGFIYYTLETDNSGYGERLSAITPDYGVSCESFILFAEEGLIKDINENASAIKLSRPLSILIIGDSLSDFSRGYNYADIIFSSFDKSHPGMIKLKNAAVGGDFITRVLERFTGIPYKGKTANGNYRQYMYERILEENPDVILIFLGHNDTRSWFDCDFNAPEITPDVQYDAYCKLIDYLREISPELKIILLSNTSSYLPAQQKNAVKSKAKGIKHCIFGIPEFMEGFNDVLKKIVQERNLDYIDIYSVTKAYQDKESLFLKGGLHLSPKGNQLIASIILKNLADRQLLEQINADQ